MSDSEEEESALGGRINSDLPFEEAVKRIISPKQEIATQEDEEESE